MKVRFNFNFTKNYRYEKINQYDLNNLFKNICNYYIVLVFSTPASVFNHSFWDIHISLDISIEEIIFAPIQAQFSGLLGICNLTFKFLGDNFLISL